jgi:hypothetical protein
VIHVGKQVGVGRRLLLEELAEEELVGGGLRRRRERCGGHSLGRELGAKIEARGSKRDAKQIDPKHFSSPFINNGFTFARPIKSTTSLVFTHSSALEVVFILFYLFIYFQWAG